MAIHILHLFIFNFNNCNNINGKYIASSSPHFMLIGTKLVSPDLGCKTTEYLPVPILNGLSWSYMSMSNNTTFTFMC